MSQNNTVTHGNKIIEVSNSTKQHADNSGNHANLLTALFSPYQLITQYEVPFTNKSEATKRSRDRKESGK